MTNALIMYGGWEGHNPAGMAAFFADFPQQGRIQPTVTSSLDALEHLQQDDFQLVVPVWTMEHLESHLLKVLLDAAQRGISMRCLMRANRVELTTNSIAYARFIDDFPAYAH